MKFKSHFFLQHSSRLPLTCGQQRCYLRCLALPCHQFASVLVSL